MSYDIIIIGGGPAGYVAAVRAAELGKKVALVEAAALGGVCLNWGCIPTKALLKSSHVYRSAKDAAAYGVDIEGDISVNLAKMVERSRSVADTMSKGIDFLMKKNGVEVFNGFARLLVKDRVEVSSPDTESITIEAENIILATGARPRALPSLPVDGVRVINSRDALLLKELPRTMVVVGSGAIGSELATFYAELGVGVTLVEYLPEILPLEDSEVSKTMERMFRKLGVTVLTSTEVKSIAVGDNGCVVATEGKKGVNDIEADIVLSAVGIKSNIENIGLEALGIVTERDKIVVDSNFKTNVEGVYAVGDIIATPALAHVASAEAVKCVEYICGLKPEPIDYSAIPSCVYTSPEVASVGMTEAKAIEKGFEIKVGRFQFMASGRAAAAGRRDGFVKLIFDARTDVLLGAHFVGENVTEMIAEATLAKMYGTTLTEILNTVHPHPTMSEAIYEAATTLHTQH